MERDLYREAAIIINDLDSMVHRIEALQAHPRYTEALVAVQEAKKALQSGLTDIHQSDLRKRFSAI
jgi:hypothetical protein